VSIQRYLRGEVAAAELLAIDSLDMARLAKLGISCLDAKLIDQARGIFRLMARLRPDSHLVHLYLGIIAEAEDDLVTAKEAYERAGTLLEAEGDLSADRRRTLYEIVLLLACVLIRLGRTEDAVAYLSELRSAGEPEVQLEAQELLMTVDAGRAQS
jgi:tetratricopeptide (TPR) repeat protein